MKRRVLHVAPTTKTNTGAQDVPVYRYNEAIQ